MATGRIIVETRLEGIDDLDAVFRELGEVWTKDILNKGLNKAVQPTIDAAKALAPRSTDRRGGTHLADAITRSRRMTKTQEKALGGRPKTAFVVVGPNWSKVNHGHLVEFGHTVKVARGARRGQSPRTGVSFVGPRPFMRPAWEATRGTFPTRFLAEVRSAIAPKLRSIRRSTARGKSIRKNRRAVGV